MITGRVWYFVEDMGIALERVFFFDAKNNWDQHPAPVPKGQKWMLHFQCFYSATGSP
jgi:hypothetical protein